MQSAMQMFVARFASKDPLMQSAMQMFVARFASKDPRIRATTDAKRDTTSACGALSVCATTNTGVLRLRLRMTTRNLSPP